MEAAGSSEMLVFTNETTQLYSPKHSKRNKYTQNASWVDADTNYIHVSRCYYATLDVQM
jgi:hypothetical protein